MVGDFGDHRDIRPGVGQDQRVDVGHAMGDALHQAVDIALWCGGFTQLCGSHGVGLSGSDMGATIG
ncbi:MAG: hypothetical protein AcusKO_00860 [Acuticoccus sp.]